MSDCNFAVRWTTLCLGLLIASCSGECGGTAIDDSDDGVTVSDMAYGTDAQSSDGAVARDVASPDDTAMPSDTAPGIDAAEDQGGPLDLGPDPPVDLPGSIDGVEPESQANHPPMIDGNGYLYRVTESEQDDGNNPRMMRSIDDGATWEEVDSPNRPSARDLEGCWQLQVGTSIILTVAANNDVWFNVFNTSDAPERPDEWVIDEHVVDELNNSGGVVQFSSVAQTRDGQFWLFHSGTVRSGNHEIQYRRRDTNGNWSDATILNQPGESLTGPRITMGANDVGHLFYTDYGNAELYWRTLAPDGTLSAPTRVDVDGLSSERIPHTNAVISQDGGVEIVTVGWADDSGALWSARIEDGEVQAPELITAEPVLEDPSVARNDGTVAHFAVDQTTVHVLWTDDDSGHVLHAWRPHDGAWTAPSVAWDSGDDIAWWVYGNVYERRGRTRLGFTYDIGEHEDDTGNIEYDEIDL